MKSVVELYMYEMTETFELKNGSEDYN